MTRINLIDPSELTDQHLLAEYRELPRIFGIVRKKVLNWKIINFWNNYTLWKWHVSFFYNKLLFLNKRFDKIVSECLKRGFKIKYTNYDISDIPEIYKNDFIPNKQEIEISKKRIDEKINQKKWFYKKNWNYIN